MTGSLMVVLLPAWVGICAWVAHAIGELFTDNPLRPELKAVLFLALLPLVLLDELVGKAQFDQLCATRAALTVHGSTHGRAVYLREFPVESIPGIMVPVQVRKRVYLDAAIHEPVVSFDVLEARGGKLARLMADAGASPLTFSGHCPQPHWHGQLSSLGLRLVQQTVEGAAPAR